MASLGLPEPQPQTAEFGALMGIRYYMLTFLVCVNVGLQNALITLFEFSVVRAVVEQGVRGVLRFAATRWPRAARVGLSDRALERLFLILSVAGVMILSIARRRQPAPGRRRHPGGDDHVGVAGAAADWPVRRGGDVLHQPGADTRAADAR